MAKVRVSQRAHGADVLMIAGDSDCAGNPVSDHVHRAQLHIPGARTLPMGEPPLHADELPRTAPVYVVCASGNRSLAAADYLVRRSIRAYSVAGGTGAWQRSGRPTVRGRHAFAAPSTRV